MKYLGTLLVLLAIIAFSACETAPILAPEDDGTRQRTTIVYDKHNPLKVKSKARVGIVTDKQRKEVKANENVTND